LRKASCFLWKDIIIPQLKRYVDRFRLQGIAVEHVVKHCQKEEELEIKADKGLIAQVVANLFSNVAKYTVTTNSGSGVSKRIDCNALYMKDFFGRGFHGVRVQVFSSGPPIDKKNSERIFNEGFRLTDRESIEGTGHGLHFVKNVVEVHGGIVGHIPEEFGNQFYFVIPV